MDIFDIIKGGEIVILVHEPERLVVTWNRNKTFNVYGVDDSTGKWLPVECFTVAGEAIDTVGLAQAKAESWIEQFLADNSNSIVTEVGG